MTTQSEAKLEESLIRQLVGMGYDRVKIENEAGLKANLKAQLEKFNGEEYSGREFDKILNHLSKGSVFEKSKALHDLFAFKREDGEDCYVRFYDSENSENNLLQVTNQVTIEGKYRNRYDVTILINGLPLVHIELKRRGLELKEAFNQINRYQRHTFLSNSRLFQYVQIFVISNGVNTKYYANNRKQSFKQTFFWADENNKNITELKKFAASFLEKNHLGKMISHYIVQKESDKVLMVLRPYQYYATEAIIGHVGSGKNGYIWHTTGSGKTLTSFKASQIVMDLPNVDKVVFVVDRRDLDYQTMTEFNEFKAGSVDATNNTKSLVEQFNDTTKLIVTTIQKLNNAICNKRYEPKMNGLKDKNIVFIFDECHRSQFGMTHKKITEYFSNCQMFGFTGTPIFADNASKNKLGKRTTKSLFGDCLHKYVITDAIRDENVLRFSVEYIGRYKSKSNTFVDIDVEDIDTKEVLESPERVEKIVDYIIHHHTQKTHRKEYSAIFAVPSIATLITYYEKFKKKIDAGETDLRIATIFSYGVNEDDRDANGLLAADDLDEDAEPEKVTKHTREKLDEFIADYNAMYGTSCSTKDSKLYENYFKDISKRLKEREKESFKDENRLDILLVVNMFLTGFDAKKVNTLYVDRPLKHHGLVQAYSRTNRILNEQKSQGNILCFRNLKEKTDEAIAMFSNKDPLEDIFLPPYEKVVRKFSEAYAKLLMIAPTVSAVDDFVDETQELAFIQAFRELMRLRNVLTSFIDFDWADLPMTQQAFEDYKSKYLDLYEKVKGNQQIEKTSILEDVDFELELIHRDDINVAYILKLIAKLKITEGGDTELRRQAILDLMGGDIDLRSKRELIEKFIDEQMPHINADDIPDEFQKYWEEQKVLALGQLCAEENLDHEQFKALMEAYIFDKLQPTRKDIRNCLKDRPSFMEAGAIGRRIIDKMKRYIEVFSWDMTG